ncbi:hypothetical protein C1645_6269 [Glomus cerebriforme]|uniref:Uncharacterized protein n=1 Tax=Glomus cerebriforme TaxID=658196 RepID=A0A397S690_9GLOM|nr:hypothetical protein C1645_6269 [Glomus cerebriforme]
MSVPKHLAEKAARRRSREEGKPREKNIIVPGSAAVSDVIDKAMEKFGILDGIVDDGERILENDDGKPRYRLMVIVDGEEKLLDHRINVLSVYPSPPNLHHLSIDSFDSNVSSALDYRPDEPIFVLRLLRPEDRQQRSMPSISEINRYTQDMKLGSPSLAQNLNSNKENNEPLSKKQLIEQQRKYSRAKQKSIISTRKNAEGVDILTRIGSIRSSRIFGAKVRYSFLPAGSAKGEEIDISDIIEDIWGDDELLNVEVDNESESTKEQPSSPPTEEYNDNRLSVVTPSSTNKKEQYRRSTTQDVDILEKIVDNNNSEVTQSMEDRIERVLNKVRNGHYGTGAIRNRQNQSNQNDNKPNPNDPPQSVKINGDNESIDDSVNLDSESANSISELPSKITADGSRSRYGHKTRKRSPSAASASSINFNNTVESSASMQVTLPSTRKQRSSSIASSLTESDWILTDDFGLQELLVLIRSGVNMLELKERRRSGWHLNDDPEKILEQIKPTEILDEIKAVFSNVNDELDKLEQELDQIMDDAVRAF